MRIVETETTIDAPAQTVWGILDDLERYPEWNSVVPDLSGMTIVGNTITGTLKQPNTLDVPLSPKLTRIVAGRELRWLSLAPDPAVFSAEHIFILRPMDRGTTKLVHNEVFTGTIVEDMWQSLDTNLRAAYNEMNQALKRRAEAVSSAAVLIHPAVDGGMNQDVETGSQRLVLRCRCPSSPVVVEVSERLSHNHLCGCSKCWKPHGALFAQIAVVPSGAAKLVESQEKLEIVDERQAIKRYACRDCRTHMVGRVEDGRHHFFGLEFVHPELSDSISPAPEFAAFVSSVIDNRIAPLHMESIRRRLQNLGIPFYDAFSPEIMDIIAWHRVKLAKEAIRSR